MKTKTFTVKLRTENAAFEGDNLRPELARILRVLAERIENGADVYMLQDVNGNTVGSAHVGTIRLSK